MALSAWALAFSVIGCAGNAVSGLSDGMACIVSSAAAAFSWLVVMVLGVIGYRRERRREEALAEDDQASVVS